MVRFRRIFLIVLIVLLLLTIALQHNEWFINQVYTSHIYPLIIEIQWLVTNWISFSVGDILLLVLLSYLLIRFVKAIFKIVQNHQLLCVKHLWKTFLYRTFVTLCTGFILFYWLWGFNYYRKPIATQLINSQKTFTAASAIQLSKLLTDSLNKLAANIDFSKLQQISRKQVFRDVETSYQQIQGAFAFLQMKHANLKPSVYSYIIYNAGYSGYYNPFTSECQTIGFLPPILQYSVGAHEAAHRLGYAKEMEANFIAFVVSDKNGNTEQRYAAYLSAFEYAQRKLLIMKDTVTYQQNNKALHPTNTLALQTIQNFYKNEQSTLGIAFNKIYSLYLQQHGQPNGLASYGDVVVLLAAYFEKEPK